MKISRIALLALISLAIVFLSFVALVSDQAVSGREAQYPDILLSSYRDKGYYKFNPQTILGSLDWGETNVFLPLIATPEARIHPSPFPWTQFDYLKIAGALHQYVWRENLENWELESMFFDGDCQYDPIGFDAFSIIYFKATGLRDYTAHKMDIYPLTDEVDWGGGTSYSHSLFTKWSGMDLKKLNVTADHALQTAEDNGGRQARSEVENVCRIHISLTSGTGLKWNVDYSSTQSSTYPINIFSITVDPYTGSYKILPSK